MGRIKYPACSQCSRSLNPNISDDCDRYYIVGGEIYCADCFKDWLHDIVDDEPDVMADALNIMRVYVEEEV